MSASTPTLESLPTEIIQRIGHFLQPRIPINLNNKTNDLTYWTQPALDLISLRSTSRTLWHALRASVGVSFGLTLPGQQDGADLAAALQVITGHQQEGTIPKLFNPGGDRLGLTPMAGSGDEGEAPVGDQSVNPPLEPKFLVPGLRIRHFHLHITNHGLATFHQSHCLARALTSMPKLESFAFAFLSEAQVCQVSPYSAAVISADTLAALAELKHLQAVFLCGVKLTLRPAYGNIYDSVPEFGLALTELHLSAVHDSVLAIIPAAKGLKELHAWRDFARAPRIGPGEWWEDSAWETLEELDLVGWAGTQGRPMLDHLINSIQTVQSATPPRFISLRSVRLMEPFHHRLFMEQILPTFGGLPQLNSLAFIVWRDRNFGPAIFSKISNHTPNLIELTVGLENEDLNWWPGSMSDYSTALATLPKLRVLTWNYSPYADISFDETRPTVVGPVMSLTARSPALRELRWIGQEDYLSRASQFDKWEWRRDFPPELATASASALLGATADGQDDAEAPNENKENNALAVCATQAGQIGPDNDAVKTRRDKDKSRASIEAEVRVVAGLGRGESSQAGEAGAEHRGPRRSLFGDLTRSATASPGGLDLGPVIKSGGMGSSQEDRAGGEGVAEGRWRRAGRRRTTRASLRDEAGPTDPKDE